MAQPRLRFRIILCSVALSGFAVQTSRTACGQTKEAKEAKCKYEVWVFKMDRGKWVKQPERTLDTDDAKQALDYVEQVKRFKGWTATSNAPARPMELVTRDGPRKVPPSLLQWELLATKEGVRESGRLCTVTVFSDGRCEPWDKGVVHSTLNEQLRIAVFTAARDTFNSMNFVMPVVPGPTWDAADYDLRLASGSRAMRVRFDQAAPEHMGFANSLDQGFRVLNGRSREFRRCYPPRYGSPPRRQALRPAGGRELVPGLSADWISVSMEIISQGCKMKVTVYNPKEMAKLDTHCFRNVQTFAPMEFAIFATRGYSEWADVCHQHVDHLD
jgi:hypothetical protein